MRKMLIACFCLFALGAPLVASGIVGAHSNSTTGHYRSIQYHDVNSYRLQGYTTKGSSITGAVNDGRVYAFVDGGASTAQCHVTPGNCGDQWTARIYFVPGGKYWITSHCASFSDGHRLTLGSVPGSGFCATYNLNQHSHSGWY